MICLLFLSGKKKLSIIVQSLAHAGPDLLFLMLRREKASAASHWLVILFLRRNHFIGQRIYIYIYVLRMYAHKKYSTFLPARLVRWTHTCCTGKRNGRWLCNDVQNADTLTLGYTNPRKWCISSGQARGAHPTRRSRSLSPVPAMFPL